MLLANAPTRDSKTITRKESHEALRHYNRSIELNDELAEAYMYRGVLYVQKGDTASAEADLKALESLNPSLANELRWVIQHGHEKKPEQFFGVVREIL